MEEYTPTLKVDGEFLGHGVDDKGTYEGFLVNGECKYYYVETGEEVK